MRTWRSRRRPVRRGLQPDNRKGAAAAESGVTDIRPPATLGGEGAPDLRAQWMAPIVASQHESATIYAGFQFVFRSTNRGETWERISPDLTGNDPSRMLLKSSSAIPYQTIVALAESPSRAAVLYAGTDDGRLHVTRDGGKSWTDLSPSLPRKWVSRIVPSRHAEGTIYVTLRGREDDDFAAYIYRSTDGGKTFASIAGNVPAGPVNVIREDPTAANVLYIGTDFGAFVTTNGGEQWRRARRQPPVDAGIGPASAPAGPGDRDLDVRSRDVVDGRSFLQTSTSIFTLPQLQPSHVRLQTFFPSSLSRSTSRRSAGPCTGSLTLIECWRPLASIVM